MAKSRLQTDEETCYLCNKYMGKGDKHHIFNGGGYRDKSEEDGMFVYVHRVCHSFIHNHPMTARTLKQRGQRAWMAEIGTLDEFIKRYGKNYLGGEE